MFVKEKATRFSTDTGATGRVYREAGAYTFRIDCDHLEDESPWFGNYYDSEADAVYDCRHYLSQLGTVMPVQALAAKCDRG